ncbi:collagen alpha-3(VI) chain-like [Branchiostoma floridae]|uniref:Collagen alpha-3(VI) chain-like n=1 Tax=Branchiostoma floridae TaxID=7739 RepID=A0A9J7HLJ4_BRAFL|nr:collagen alpha-3(VI) chain-like [Branchiostoma floridae]
MFSTFKHFIINHVATARFFVFFRFDIEVSNSFSVIRESNMELSIGIVFEGDEVSTVSVVEASMLQKPFVKCLSRLLKCCIQSSSDIIVFSRPESVSTGDAEDIGNMWGKWALIFCVMATLSDAEQITHVNNKTCPVDVMFLLDGSWSMGPEIYQKEKEYVVNVVKCLSIKNFTVGVINYTSIATMILPLWNHGNIVDFQDLVRDIDFTGGLKRTGGAIEYMIAVTKFRAGARKVAVVVTDGSLQDSFYFAVSYLKGTLIFLFRIEIFPSSLCNSCLSFWVSPLSLSRVCAEHQYF